MRNSVRAEIGEKEYAALRNLLEYNQDIVRVDDDSEWLSGNGILRYRRDWDPNDGDATEENV